MLEPVRNEQKSTPAAMCSKHVGLELGKAETQNPPKERTEDADYRDKYSKTNSKEKYSS